MEREPITIYNCERRKGAKCTYEGKLPSGASESRKRWCTQHGTDDEIKCDQAIIKATNVTRILLNSRFEL